MNNRAIVFGMWCLGSKILEKWLIPDLLVLLSVIGVSLVGEMIFERKGTGVCLIDYMR